MTLRRTFALPALCLAVLSAPAAAQRLPGEPETDVVRSNVRGPLIGVRGNLASIKLTDATNPVAEKGGGAGLMLGYGFTPHIVAVLRGDHSSMDYAATTTGERYNLTQVDLGARYSFSDQYAALRPYLEVALTHVIISDELDGSDYTFSGNGMSAAVGLEYFLRRTLSFDLALSGTRGKLTDGEFGGDPIETNDNIMNTRVTLGLSFRPMAGR